MRNRKNLLMGGYRIWQPGCEPIRVPNALIEDGFVTLLKMLFQGDNSVIAGGGNFYIGLRDNNYSVLDTLASITGEPTADVTYARQAVTRDAIGFPTVELLTGDGHVRSKVVEFQSLGTYPVTVQRMFLASTLDNTGKLFSTSASFPNPVTVTSANPLFAQFDLFLN